jgi:hypothetical protein
MAPARHECQRNSQRSQIFRDTRLAMCLKSASVVSSMSS